MLCSMRSKRALEGYLMVDHRAGAPGPSMAGPFTRTGLYESATLTCSHCQAQIILRPERTRARERCFRCDKYICDRCVAPYRLFGCQGSYNDKLDRLQTKLISEQVTARL